MAGERPRLRKGEGTRERAPQEAWGIALMRSQSGEPPNGWCLRRGGRESQLAVELAVPQTDVAMDEDVPLQEEFLACHGAETQVLKYGPWSDLSSPGSHGSPKLLVLVVVGNPGIPAFYLSFAKALYLTLEKRHPVWVISHAGHVMAPSGVKVTKESPEDPGSGTTDDVFGLEGQVEHKLAFLRRYVPGPQKLVLIGHSIGAYILLEMMKRAPQLPVRTLLYWRPS
ncbi:lipid droplet-associated hydrolase-like [Gracilinanus agilis]|uniref:lipid droplet-associated hydrolase-like n=1 Tax=Gracilinanus agilis TaxID=191870 RepID=UPI001CFE1AD4|nr:lipid droplet-associated hydrolase-like [Gracilinanus agilis]